MWLFSEFCTSVPKFGFLQEEVRVDKFSYNGRCVRMFDTSHEETRDFKPNWTLISNNSYEARTRTELAFLHQESMDGYTIQGLHGFYPAAGYFATLGKYMSKVLSTLEMLRKSHWIDRLTKVLIIDTVTYNANTNLFTRIRIVMEQPSIGNIIIKGDIRSFVLYAYIGDSGMVTLLLQFVWLIVMIYMTVKMVRGIVKQGKAYFTSNYWNIWRFIGLTFAVLAAVTFIVKVIFAIKLIERVKNELGKFNNFEMWFLNW